MQRIGQDTEPSDSAKSTPSASASCERTGQMSLFGETCERSQPQMWPTPRTSDHRWPGMHGNGGQDLRTEVALTSSPPATPASHSLSPGSDWARKMTATYGRKFTDWYLNSGPTDACLRTLLGTSIWASMTCYLTWKKSATPQGRLLFRLVPSAPPTVGIGSGLSLPTPRVEGFDAGKHRGKPDSLHSYAKMWPTPQTHDVTTRGNTMADHHHYPHDLSNAVQTVTGMKLNSTWVSRMMGYPDDWLTLDGEEHTTTKLGYLVHRLTLDGEETR